MSLLLKSEMDETTMVGPQLITMGEKDHSRDVYDYE